MSDPYSPEALAGRERKVVKLVPVLREGLRAVGLDLRRPEVLAKVQAWGDTEWQALADEAGVRLPSVITRAEVIRRTLRDWTLLPPGSRRRIYR